MSQPRGIPALDPLYADLRRSDPVRPAVLLDVRDEDEHRDVHVEGALHIPTHDLPRRMAEIPKDRPVMVICASGGRSQQVTFQLLQQGWTDVGNVAGGIITWERMGLPVVRRARG